MEKILIPLAHYCAVDDTIAPLNYVRETYIQTLEEYDLLPLFVSHAMGPDTITALFSEASGLLLMGGLDISAEHYSDQPNHPANKVSAVRDEFELQLARRAREVGLPTLGICRGCQVMAVAAGGSLHQHIPDDFSSDIHGVSVDGPGGYDHVIHQKHPAYVKTDTTLHEIIGQENITVTSGHHQAVDEPGGDMRVAAVSSEGVPEAIETTQPEAGFFLGLQSHPEANPDSPLRPVFTAFRTAAAAYTPSER